VPTRIAPRATAPASREGDGLVVGLFVDRSPGEAFTAVVDVRQWWSGEIDGVPDRIGAVFTYRHGDVLRSTQQVTQSVPGRRVAWHVIEGYLAFSADPYAWTGTEITFDLVAVGGGTEIRFTHVGLVAELDCFESCAAAWQHHIGTSLRRRIIDGPRPAKNDRESAGERPDVAS
jgi:hypothetical protein